MTNEEKAKLTYELIEKRKAYKRRQKDKEISAYKKESFERYEKRERQGKSHL